MLDSTNSLCGLAGRGSVNAAGEGVTQTGTRIFGSVKTWNMGRQYGGIPLASALLFAGIFATLHHVLWLPLAVALMAMILLTETELRLGFEAFEVRKHLGPLTVQTKSWNLADMEGVVLAE